MNAKHTPGQIEITIPAERVVLCLQGLTFLKGVLIGLGYTQESSSINRIEILYSMLKESLADGLAEAAIARAKGEA